MKYVIASIALLMLLTACASWRTGLTGAAALPSTDETVLDENNVQEGCYLMQHVRAGVNDCFGCSNGNCREPDQNTWQPLDEQSKPRVKCIASPRGCVLA